MDISKYTDDQLRAELAARAAQAERLAAKAGIWPKYLDVYVNNPKWDESVTEWINEECGWPEDDERRRELAYIAYEVKLTYAVEEDAAATLVAVDGYKLSGEKWAPPSTP